MGKAPAAAARRFSEWRYGMFIHFGLFSIMGRHEWAMCYERIPFEEYRPLIDRFDPKPGCVRRWLELAKEAGMRYACLTTRHHEGFCLFDSAQTDFQVMHSPAGRDLVAEYVEACRDLDLGVGLYYSVADWGDKGFVAGPIADPGGWQRFVDVAHAQLEELMTSYGEISYLFYDGCPPPESWGAAEINEKIRGWQPDILISDRCSLDEDVKSAEGFTIGDPGKLWESCITSNKSWGFNYGDTCWKHARELVELLQVCAHNGGNLLFNIGPDGSGEVPAPAVELLREAGAWVQRNGEAIFGTDAHPFNYADQKLSTAKGNTAYLPLHYYHGRESTIAGIANRVLGARILGTDQPVAFRQEGARVFLDGLPEAAPDPLLTVIALDLDGAPAAIPHPLMGKAKYEEVQEA